MSKQISNDELECWIDCYGEPLQLGLIVRGTEDCEHTDFKNQTFVITSISFDCAGVNIGLNESGRPCDLKTAYDGFRLNELAPVLVGSRMIETQGVFGLELLLSQMVKVETYEDCPQDQKLLVWTGDCFDTEFVTCCADSGACYPENGVAFTHFIKLPDEQAFMSRIEAI